MSRLPHCAGALAGLALLGAPALAQAPPVQHAYLKADHPDVLDQYGTSVALAGGYLAIGAPLEASSAAVGSDNATPGAGAVYLYRRIGLSWVALGKLKAPTPKVGDFFGAALALDGDTLVVGTPGDDVAAQDAGAVHVFERVGPTWVHTAELRANNGGLWDQLGMAVALDGDRVLAGAPLEDSSATGVDGNGANDALADAGAAYVFERNAGVWSQVAYLKASHPGADDRFGTSVAVSGGTVAVGAPQEDGGGAGIDPPHDNASFWAGAAYVFSDAGGAWHQAALVKAANPQLLAKFGIALALDGDRLVVGAPNESSSAVGVGGNPFDTSAPGAGAAYVFERGASWQQAAYLKATNTAPNEQFGRVLALDGDRLLVTALRDDSGAHGVDGDPLDTGAPLSGAVFELAHAGAGWQHAHYLKAFKTGQEQQFGSALALDGTTVVVGANQEAEVASGVNGATHASTLAGLGAAFVYDAAPEGCGSTSYGTPSAVNAGRLEVAGLGTSIQRLLLRTSGFSNGVAWLAVSAAPANLPFAGGQLLVDPTLLLTASGPAVALGASGGGFDLSLDVPPGLVGIPVYLQAAQYTTWPSPQWTLSNGLSVTPCP